MGILLFRKRVHEKSEGVIFTCPQKGCAFSTMEDKLMQRHIDWKHPEIKAGILKINNG